MGRFVTNGHKAKSKIPWDNYSIAVNQALPTEFLLCICTRMHGRVEPSNIHFWIEVGNINFPSGTRQHQFLDTVLQGVLIDCFCFKILVCGLIVGSAINGAEFIGRNVAVSFSEGFLWKVLIILQRCMTTKAGSQVLSSSE